MVHVYAYIYMYLLKCSIQEVTKAALSYLEGKQEKLTSQIKLLKGKVEDIAKKAGLEINELQHLVEVCCNIMYNIYIYQGRSQDFVKGGVIQLCTALKFLGRSHTH